MSKKKPKGSKKNKAYGDLLDTATLGLKKFRRFARQVNKLSSTQKVVGGLAVLAAGYAFITNSSPDESPAAAPDLGEATPPSATLSTPHASSPARASKPQRTKPASPTHHVPFSEERP
ncbi:hypothetical protein ACFQT0_29920 [Hymenobacter humi]|uniref:Uncharacterized protein n=1 Tax=Hymenobacter humi TaxID=1411620 RepID=A0ABW2UCH9_9BACT